MEGSDVCFEIVERVKAGFVYSEAVARYDFCLLMVVPNLLLQFFVLFYFLLAQSLYETNHGSNSILPRE